MATAHPGGAIRGVSEGGRLRFFLLLSCFFLSGLAALLYQTAWAREFEFVFGTSELAVVSVLAAYMAGLAAGSAAAGRLVTRVRRPVLWYGLLELGIAVSALAVPWGIRGATWLLTATLGGRSAPPDAGEVSAAFFYVVAALVVLAIPTGLMGATLPLLARHAVRSDEEIGRRVGALYATNTLGAVVGTVATAFVLLPEIGLRSTVHVGAGLNALVFLTAALLSRVAGTLAEAPATALLPLRFHWVLPLVALSGAVSFGYEVLWTRLIGHLLGGTIQGFATMLASFLLGIALGSAVAARLARDPARAARGFAVAQLGTAALSLVAFGFLDRVPALARTLGAGQVGALGGNALIAALVLLPGSLCIGATFPFAVRLVARDETEAGPAAARVYVWSTLGSITGALATGFLLLPALRFEGVIALAAGANLALGLAAALLARPVAKALVGLAAAGLNCLLLIRPEVPWSILRHDAMQSGSTWTGRVVYYGVGRSSTVLLLEQLAGFRLTNNGLPEAIIRHAEGTTDTEPAAWLGMLPALLRPGLRDMLVIGFGGGVTVEAIPPSVQEITVIELEGEVGRAHEWLASRRDAPSPLRDPRVRLVLNDARGALQLTDARFGAIVSQPSHPWTAGASHLYTREFFALAARHLAPGGVFVQWIGLAFVDEPLLRSLVATLVDVFPHVSIFEPLEGTLLFAASDSPLDPVETSGAALSAAPEHYARVGLRLPEDVAATWQLATGHARDFASASPLLTDDENPLATRSALIGRKAVSLRRDAALFAGYEPLPVAGDGLDPLYLISRVAANGAFERAERMAQALLDPRLRHTALGWARIEDIPKKAAATFRSVLATEPGADAARFGLLRLMRQRVEAGDPDALELAGPLEGTAAAVVAGWRHAALGRFEELAALDPILAAADPRDPARLDALRLRIQWRAASPDPARRTEGAALAVELLQDVRRVQDLLVASQALAAADRPAHALALVDQIARAARRTEARRVALAVLDSLHGRVDEDESRRIRRLLERRRRSLARRRRPWGGGGGQRLERAGGGSPKAPTPRVSICFER